MLKRLLPLSCAVLVACGADSLTVVLNAQNNSGESGIATLTSEGARQTKVLVKVRRVSLQEDTQNAHIHPGTCGEIGKIFRPLALLTPPNPNDPETPKDVLPDDGGFFVSVSHVDAGFDELTQGNFVINAHDQFDQALYVSCGALRK